MMNKNDRKQSKVVQELENLINTDRVFNFSDGVFAFAATLLVLKIDLPDLTRQQIYTGLPAALWQLWPQYFANIISFLIIGYYWLNHHAIFEQLERFDKTVVWLNILFLICISFIPFPVDLFGDFHDVPIAIAFYSASLALVGYFLAGIWWYSSYNNRLIGSSLSKRHVRYYLFRNLLAPVIFTLSVPLAFFDTMIAQYSWIFVIIGILFINRSFHYHRLSAIEKELV